MDSTAPPGIAVAELMQLIDQAEDLPPDQAAELRSIARGEDNIPVAPPLVQDPAGEAEQESSDIRTQLGSMNIPQKVKLALFGNSVCRSLLIGDPNRIISLMVLRNPRMTLREVEEFSKNPNLSEGVLRAISEGKQWMRHYPIKANIVTNPKTPQDVALRWLRYLNEPEVKKIANSKSIPQLIATTAKKRLEDIKRGK